MYTTLPLPSTRLKVVCRGRIRPTNSASLPYHSFASRRYGSYVPKLILFIDSNRVGLEEAKALKSSPGGPNRVSNYIIFAAPSDL